MKQSLVSEMEDLKQGTIEINGLSDLAKNLESFSDRIAKNILTGGVRAGANVIRNDARVRAAVAEKVIIKKFKGQNVSVQPGFMKKKIASWKSRNKQYAVTVNVGVAGYKDRFAKLFPFWWRFLEFGTSKMSAKPFLRPAFDSKKKEAVERMRDYLSSRIDKEASKRG